MDLIAFLQREWATIAQAPMTFAIGCAIVAGLAYGAARWRYKAQIDTLRERVELLKDNKDVPPKPSAGLWG